MSLNNTSLKRTLEKSLRFYDHEKHDRAAERTLRRTTFFGRLCLWGILGFMTTVGCNVSSSDNASSDNASSDNAEQTWRFAIEESVGSVQHDYATRFEKEIEQRSNGQIEVVIYPYGTLGTSTQITEQLNLGILQFAMASPGSLGKFIPELQAFLLHFVLPGDEKQMREQFNQPTFLQALDSLYQPKGLKLLSVFSEGAMAWTLDREVRQPQDFQGLKMRVMTSPILLSAYEAYQASPTPMPYSEVYSGLQLRMIDGQVNPLFAIERQKFHEVTSWLIMPGHTSFVTTCAANRDFFDSLSDSDREMVNSVLAELDQYIFQQQQQLQWKSLKTILRSKLDKQKPYNICGNLAAFRETLTAEEQNELLDENPYLKIHPPLNESERHQFQEASQAALTTFYEIGGQRGPEILKAISEPQ